ncbi:hypothetical protein [Undibacterium pigrum]|uniref:Uncharacterized protein n=1 Tax=Undibacterium pigrum TaxID=401470 RepID=A0A318JKN3_9BURK|nr:hypothetical protein [Undibacterium pigrum]PXX44274.1 hypothetical protein DFR42_103544 [Undibacterium pigrum]
MIKRENFSTTLREQPKRLPIPTRYGFAPEVWCEAFEALNDGNPEDVNLFNLGLVFGQKSQKVANSVKHISSRTKSHGLPELAPLFSQRANDVMRIAMESHARAMEDADVISQEQIREMMCFIDSAGNSNSVQVPMEAVVDAIANAIKTLKRSDGFGDLNSNEINYLDIEDSLRNLLNLAQYDLSLQRMWDSAVWLHTQVQVDPQSGEYMIDETKSDLARRFAIDLSRRPIYMARSFKRFELLESIPNSSDVLIPQVMLEDGHLTVRAVPAFNMPKEERDALIKARHANGLLQEGILLDFVETEHPTVKLKISEILLIWGELALIAQQLYSLAQSRDSEKEKVTLTTVLNSRFRLTDIVAVIKSCVVLSRERVAECIDFLCFQPTREATLWGHPILPAGDDICLFWWPLLGVHHARTLSAWARMHKSLSESFESKGALNEIMMKEELLAAIERGPYREHIRYVGSSLDPRLKSDEEIDFLILVGDTAFVIETAAIPSPAEAYEVHDTEKRLDQKAGQCTKKCAILRQDLTQIDEWQDDRFPIRKVTKVVGLVVTNSYLRDGNYSGDITQCHWDTLLNIISYGGMLFGVLRDSQEFTLKAEIKPRAGESVADSILNALKKSPKAEFYASSLTYTDMYIKGYDEPDQAGIYRRWNMEFPSPNDIEELLNNCSFGASLVEVEDPSLSQS